MFTVAWLVWNGQNEDGALSSQHACHLRRLTVSAGVRVWNPPNLNRGHDVAWDIARRVDTYMGASDVARMREHYVNDGLDVFRRCNRSNRLV